MPELVPPTSTVHQSFLDAMSEFQAEGRGPGGGSMIDYEIETYGWRWATTEGFDEYVRELRDQSREDAPRPDGYVPATTLWWIDGAHYLGRIALRHRLTPQLLEVGGHIGYDVRPTARRRGHATAMLRALLPVANHLSIDPALVTCDADNVASRRVIENCGGVLEDRRANKLRFWVPTSSAAVQPDR